MFESVIAALFALALWWLSTGLVLLAVRRFAHAEHAIVGYATAIWAVGLAGLYMTRDQTGLLGAYTAFTSALLVWAWHEVSFLTGLVTGPRRSPAPIAEARGRAPLKSAIETLLYHELAIVVSFAALLAVTASGANPFGLMTFLVLWVMRLSAKFNLYLGVPNLGESFLPQRLAYLQSYFCRRPMNFLFPVSVTAATGAAVYLGSLALAPDTDAHAATGYALVTTLLILAVVEHWFMVLPFEATALWSWGLAEPADTPMDPNKPKTVSQRSVGRLGDNTCPSTALLKGTS